ncbi:glycosyltransferase [Rhodococcoides fascians]|uniref:glycosyltransferase n=1 Tax=Rhodococcoides fascians TaxID=1828 RepID=UPI00050C0C65|nr:glycosyltransferase [Rhodococcus fascians]
MSQYPSKRFHAFPMHGSSKLVKEGFRTRDGHLLHWMSQLVASDATIEVRSRPEPLPIHLLNALRPRLSQEHDNLNEVNSYSTKLPGLRNRQEWWSKSRTSYKNTKRLGEMEPVILWNPFVATSNIADIVFNGKRTIVLDLLDDWTYHYAFAGIKSQVEEAYAKSFEGATHVLANAEGTANLARKNGRSDVRQVLNGVDPTRFSTASRASGQAKIGYVGKIGRRLDLRLIQDAAKELQQITFVFAGPILDSEYKSGLQDIPNIDLLGDVHYRDVPALLQTFDMGWVPHRVGEGEVGGDVIKTYEYRAAGLPVLSTPVQGAGQRGLGAVTVLPADEHVSHIEKAFIHGPRLDRVPEEIPEQMTWEFKAKTVLDLLDPR